MKAVPAVKTVQIDQTITLNFNIIAELIPGQNDLSPAERLLAGIAVCFLLGYFPAA